MKAIINAELVLHDHFVENGAVLFDNGVITDFGEMKNIKIPEGTEIIDAGGLYVGPGLIDIHVHAGNKIRFRQSCLEPVKAHVQKGTTTILPTLSFWFPLETYLSASAEIRRVKNETPEGKAIGGIYMEGPYTNHKFDGDFALAWANSVDKKDYEPLVSAVKDLVKVWALAPEREGILDFVKYLKGECPDVKLAVAHSEASPEEIESLIPYGLCIGTHHTNATGDRPRYSETRGVCVDETVNYHKDIYAEIISDRLGIHVHPYMQRLIREIKGKERIILITDQTYHDGPVPKGYEDATDIWFTRSGEIGGSALTLNVACRNFILHTGCSIVDAFNYGSYNPAKAVGFDDRGEIAIGKRADLIIVDHKMDVKKVILCGEEYKEN